MDRYEIRCTKEQTLKAIKLDASIIITPAEFYEELPHFNMVIDGEKASVRLPTAEQMVGFLEETFKEVSVRQSVIGSWFYELYINPYELIEKNCGYLSRREATIAAIDAALEYLTNNNN